MTKFFYRVITSIILILILYISLKSNYVLMLLLMLISIFSLNEFNNIFKKIYKRNKNLNFISMILSIFYLAFFSTSVWIFLISSSQINEIKLVFLLIVCISTDIGGYIFGKIIGGKKLTKISPNKTYSGAAGSLAISIIAGYSYLYSMNSIPINSFNTIILIILISLISQIGDLIISFFKRKAQIKDTGTILPGHGGILDRIDGILLALPLGIILI